MGAISDIITELVRLNQGSNLPKVRAVEMAGVYHVADENLKCTEYKSLREIDGSEDWVANSWDVVGISDDPEYQKMVVYMEFPKGFDPNNATKVTYPKEVKTASGKVVHLTQG